MGGYVLSLLILPCSGEDRQSKLHALRATETVGQMIQQLSDHYTGLGLLTKEGLTEPSRLGDILALFLSQAKWRQILRLACERPNVVFKKDNLGIMPWTFRWALLNT
ncbi:hypothetical protein P7K49_037053 [Saguinus oedipus]|uniref:Uncharacterized protein n=1 Tax=Saguinus oedipus TaxID=9490 RepID=A0ABQ9TLZ1_SAGOE|nr:hypothetical protein P7K49_037053 [Saguinus oedipus]